MSGITEPRRMLLQIRSVVIDPDPAPHEIDEAEGNLSAVEVALNRAIRERDALAAENAALREALDDARSDESGASRRANLAEFHFCDLIRELEGLEQWCVNLRDDLKGDVSDVARTTLGMTIEQISLRRRAAVADAALTQRARDAQDAGAYDKDPVKSAAEPCPACRLQGPPADGPCGASGCAFSGGLPA